MDAARKLRGRLRTLADTKAKMFGHLLDAGFQPLKWEPFRGAFGKRSSTNASFKVEFWPISKLACSDEALTCYVGLLEDEALRRDLWMSQLQMVLGQFKGPMPGWSEESLTLPLGLPQVLLAKDMPDRA